MLLFFQFKSRLNVLRSNKEMIKDVSFNCSYFINFILLIILDKSSEMSKYQSQDLQVYNCTFQAQIVSASMNIKFPCTFQVQWKSMNGKILMGSTKNRVPAVREVAHFDETIIFETDLLYNTKTRQFLKKDSLLMLNLMSKKRPDQHKLVGRLTVNLAKIANEDKYNLPEHYKMQYCSVNASIMFKARVCGKKASANSPQNFDRDSFSDYQSFLVQHPNLINTSMKTKPRGHTSHDQSQQKFMDIQTERILRSKSKNYMIQQSQNEDFESKRPSQAHLPHRRIQTERASIVQQPQRRNFLNSDESLRSLRAGDTSEMIRSEEKKIWDEQRKFMQERINRQKIEVMRYKQRNESLEKKLYESEIKLSNYDGRMQNNRRQMHILQKQKDLQIKQLRNRNERLKRQNDDLSYEIGKLKKTSAPVQQSSNNSQYIRLQSMYNTMKKEKDALSKKCSDLQIQLKEHKLNRQVVESKAISPLQYPQYKQLQEKYESVLKQLQIYKNKPQTSSLQKIKENKQEQTNTQLKLDNTRLREQLRVQQNTNTQLIAKIEQNAKLILQFQEKNYNLQIKNEQLQANSLKLQKKIKQLQCTGQVQNKSQLKDMQMQSKQIQVQQPLALVNNQAQIKQIVSREFELQNRILQLQNTTEELWNKLKEQTQLNQNLHNQLQFIKELDNEKEVDKQVEYMQTDNFLQQMQNIQNKVKSQIQIQEQQLKQQQRIQLDEAIQTSQAILQIPIQQQPKQQQQQKEIPKEQQVSIKAQQQVEQTQQQKAKQVQIQQNKPQQPIHQQPLKQEEVVKEESVVVDESQVALPQQSQMKSPQQLLQQISAVRCQLAFNIDIVKHLQADKQQLTDKVISLQQELNKVPTTNAKGAQNNEDTEYIRQLQDQLKNRQIQYMEKMAHIQKQMKAVKKEKQQGRQQNAQQIDVRKKVGQLQLDNQFYKEKAKQLQSSKTQIQSKYTKELSNKAQQANALVQQLQIYKEQANKVNALKKEYYKSVEEKTIAIEELNNIKEQNAKEINLLKVQMDNIKEYGRIVQGRINQKEQMIKNKEIDIQKLTKINNELKNYEKGLQEEMVKAHENKQIGTEQLKQIKLNNIRLSAQMVSVKEYNAKLQEELRKSELMVQELGKNISSLEQEHSKHVKQLSVVNEQAQIEHIQETRVQDLNAQVNKLNGYIGEYIQIIKGLQQEIQQIKLINIDIEDELLFVRQNNEKQISKYEEQLLENENVSKEKMNKLQDIILNIQIQKQQLKSKLQTTTTKQVLIPTQQIQVQKQPIQQQVQRKDCQQLQERINEKDIYILQLQNALTSKQEQIQRQQAQAQAQRAKGRRQMESEGGVTLRVLNAYSQASQNASSKSDKPASIKFQYADVQTFKEEQPKAQQTQTVNQIKPAQKQQAMDRIMKLEQSLSMKDNRIRQLEQQAQKVKKVEDQKTCKQEQRVQKVQVVDDRVLQLQQRFKAEDMLKTSIQEKNNTIKQLQNVLQQQQRAIKELNVIKQQKDNQQKLISQQQAKITQTQLVNGKQGQVSAITDKEHKVQQLLTQIQSLRDNIKEKEHIIQQLQGNNTDKESKIQQLQVGIVEKQNSIHQLTTITKQYENRIQQLQLVMRQYENRAQQLQHKVKDREDNIKQQQSKIAELEDNAHKITQQKNSQIVQSQELNRQIQLLTQEIDKEIEERNKMKDQLQAQIQKYISEVGSLRQVGQSLSLYKKASQEYEDKIIGLKEKEKNMMDSLNIIQSESKVILKEDREKNVLIDQLYSQIQNSNNGIRRLGVEVQSLRREVQEYKKELIDSDEQIVTSKKLIITLQTQNNGLNANIQELKQSYDTQCNNYKLIIQENHKQLQEAYHNKDTQANQYGAQLQSLTNQLNDKMNQIIQLNNQLNNKKIQKEQKVQLLITQYQNKLQQQNNKVNELQAQVNKVNQQANTNNNNVQSLQTQHYHKLQQLQNNYNNKMQQLQANHNAKLQQMHNQNNTKIQQLQAIIHELQNNNNNNENSGRLEQMESNLKKMEQENQLLIQKNLQYQFMKEMVKEQKYRVQALHAQVQQLNNTIDQYRKKEEAALSANNSYADLQGQLNFCDGQLRLMTQKYQQLQQEYIKAQKQNQMYSHNMQQLSQERNALLDKLAKSSSPQSQRVLQGISRKPSEQQVMILMNRINELENQVSVMIQNFKEKEVLLQKLRTVSLQITKVKSTIMKSKIDSTIRTSILSSLKPLQASVKEVIKISEKIYSSVEKLQQQAQV